MILGDNIIEGNIRRGGRGFREAAARRPDSAQESAGCRALRRGRSGGRPHRRHRREAARSRSRITPSPASTCTTATFSTRSRPWCPRGRGELEITDVNNAYIREGHHDLLVPRRLVDRRRHLRVAAARGQPGGAIAERSKKLARVLRRSGAGLMAGKSAVPRRAPHRVVRRSGTGATGECEKGIGSVIPHARLAELIAGVRVQPLPVSGRPRLLPRSAAHRATGSRRSFPPETTQISAALNYRRHHQGVSLSSAPDGLLDTGHRHVASRAGGSAAGSPTFGKRNTLIRRRAAAMAGADPARRGARI